MAGRKRRKEYADNISVGADYSRPDPLEIKNRQPGMHYRWLSKDADRLEMRKSEGYEIIKGDHPEAIHRNESADSVLKVGDLIAAKIPIKKATARQDFYRKQSGQMLEQSSSQLRRALGKHHKNLTEELR